MIRSRGWIPADCSRFRADDRGEELAESEAVFTLYQEGSLVPAVDSGEHLCVGQGTVAVDQSGVAAIGAVAARDHFITPW